MIKVQVLLSSFNGDRYLAAQIESLLKQKSIDLSILVRDDGSSDKTIEILDYYEKGGKLQYYIGENLGPAFSFFDLMKQAKEADYYAFCDQDDWWHEEKIINAVNLLEEEKAKKPKMYYSNTVIVDKELEIINKKSSSCERYTFEQYLVRNNVTGCTVVFNSYLLEIINSYTPSYVMMHDHWLALVCSGVGGLVAFDDRSFIHYRQHEENVIGANSSFIKRIRRSFLFSTTNNRKRMANELNKGYNTVLTTECSESLKKVLLYSDSIEHKLSVCRDARFKINFKFDCYFIFSILLNKY